MPWNCIVDVGITGAGPAGLALAAELCARGASVAVIDPQLERPWKPTWCGYEDELPGVPVAHRWSGVQVELDGGSHVRKRPYVQVDGAALQASLQERCARATRIRGEVEKRTGDVLSLTDGRTVACRHVVDCSGAAQVLGSGRRPTAFQTAWGLEIETDGHPWDPDTALWMDLRDLDTPPSFLYALPRDEHRVFVEETSLAAQPAVPLEVLELRLKARLDRLGVKVRAIHHTERCSIPLNMPDHPGLAFGTAGGMIHPASGYVLARVLNTAPLLAIALDMGDPASVLHRARGGFARQLHLLGLNVLTGADGPALSAFFTAFFAQPETHRDAFLSPNTVTASTVLAMTRFFLTAPAPTRKQLASPLFP